MHTVAATHNDNDGPTREDVEAQVAVTCFGLHVQEKRINDLSQGSDKI